MSREDLIEYALGIADPATAQRVQRALENDNAAREQYAELQTALNAVTDNIEAAAPSDTLRESVLAVAATETRLQGFAPRLARLFDVDLTQAQTMLTEAGEFPAERWLPFIANGLAVPGMFAWPLASRGGSMYGFVHLESGARVPRHGHGGGEEMLILDGWARDDAGRTVGPGDVIVSDPGSEHEFDILSSGSCVFAARLDGDLRF